MLDRSEVYYADPRSFNDPLDSSPGVVEGLELPRLERLFYVMAKARFGPDKANEKIGYQRYMSTEYGDYRTDPEVEDYYARNLASSVIQWLREEIGDHGVLSLASRWDCPLMWSHYANEHRGLCIEYSTKEAEFASLGKVNYRGSRAIRLSDVHLWKVEKEQAAEDRIRAAIYFSKAPDWRYEREWRDLKSKAGVHPAPAPPAAIYFGHRCHSTIIRTVIRLFEKAEFPIRFYAVRPNEKDFRLRRFRLNASEIISDTVRLPAGWEFREAFAIESERDSSNQNSSTPGQTLV